MEIQPISGSRLLESVEGLAEAGDSAPAQPQEQTPRQAEADAAEFRLALSGVDSSPGSERPDVTGRVLEGLGAMDARQTDGLRQVMDPALLRETAGASQEVMEKLRAWRADPSAGPADQMRDFGEHVMGAYAQIMESTVSSRGLLAAQNLQAQAALTNATLIRNVAFKATEAVGSIIRGR